MRMEGMPKKDTRLQRASSPDGFSIEWVYDDSEPFFEVYRSDEDGSRRVIFGTLDRVIEISLEEFQGLLNRSVETLDIWESDQHELGYIDEQGKRSI
jgi:hypothetical protein